MTEMVCVSPDARITLGCTGMYTDEHLAAWQRIVAFVHEWTDSRICLQLGHSGRKGSTRLPWEGTDIPLDDGEWERLARRRSRTGPTLPPPREMTRGRHEVRPRRFRSRDEDGSAGRLRHDRAALRTRISAFELSHAGEQPAHGRVRRIAREPAALSAWRCSTPCAPSGLRTSRCRYACRRPTGSTTDSRRRVGRSRESVRERGCRHHSRFDRSDGQRRKAGLRTSLPDAVQRSHSQRSSRADDRRRQRHRRRSGELDHRRGTSGSRLDRPAAL